jgi:hypothetical protein
MSERILERYQREYGPLAMRLDEGETACASGCVCVKGQGYDVPAIVVKARSSAFLEQPIVRCQVLGVETSQCPVLAVGIAFPGQSDSFDGWHWAWIPMHTNERRAQVRLLVTAPAWLVVVFSGEAVHRAFIVRVPKDIREKLRQIQRMIKRYPKNPGADTDRAIDAARMASAHSLGEGHLLEIVRDLHSGGEPLVREAYIPWQLIGP